MAPPHLSYDLHGPGVPASPVVLSVPHAGREYSLALRTALRAPLAALTVLEDRFVDVLALAARGGETMFVQRIPRAWIDLNRGEHERDPKLDEGAYGLAHTSLSEKVRSGLGLVPRRTQQAGEIWRRRLSADEVESRLIADHRPYHAALAVALGTARARFGAAVLLDIHSMPPVAGAGLRPQIVIGDRFGRAAAARFVHRIVAEVEADGLCLALNVPYAGGHILDAHAAPQRAIHAIQIEFDRSLYLDSRLDMPGPGMAAMVALLGRIIAALADEALGVSTALAAE